ncbi:MAG: syntaxin-2 isoform X3 [Sylvanvirus sp.]|uniref:Syntaxin-2 isoform X3 n=1 Tax=Sylvanvirus sp. TaxID=2487774 RepID=A0A3G5AIR0_9VIRU|nr:MAG: syntaxin-2 isoform X3 [Sylvanvirus sp.]
MDRLIELRTLASVKVNVVTPEGDQHLHLNTSSLSSQSSSLSYAIVLSKFESIKRSIHQIDELSMDLERSITDSRAYKRMNKSTDRKITQGRQMCQKVQSKLSTFKYESNTTISANCHTFLLQLFLKSFTRLNKAVEAIRKAHIDRQKRDLKEHIPLHHFTESEVESIIHNGQTQEVIQQYAFAEKINQTTVIYLEERHLDILQLERDVTAIYEMFRDIATLVDVQSEHLNSIELHVSKSSNYVERAETEIQDAFQYQSKARKTRLLILACCLSILLVILLPILLVSMKHS